MEMLEVDEEYLHLAYSVILSKVSSFEGGL